MTTLTLTPSEQAFLQDRLEGVPDAICEVLTSELEFTEAEVEAAIEVVTAKVRAGSFDPLALSEVEQFVLADAYAGSTVLARYSEAADAGEMPRSKYMAEVRLAGDIGRKLRAAGITTDPVNPI